jgi:hypothetical protein
MTRRKYFLAGLILAPILVYYGLLVRETIDMPYLDDYSAVLGLINNWTRLNTLHGKLMEILTSQHNEYKLMFANAVFVLQYLVSGRVNFSLLSTIGNLFVLPLLLVVYLMWRIDGREVRNKLLLFSPVSWILFQLQYYSSLNWPTASLQNIPVILFSLLAIYLLSKDRQTLFPLALCALILAIASSGNGFFVIPIGCLMLIQFRRPARFVYWLVASASMLALYLYKYNFFQSQSHSDRGIASSLHHISPLYALSFMGASIARYQSYVPAAILGACLCVAFIFSIADKSYVSSPALFYSICFIMVTSLAVSGLRSDFGIAQSLVSRYRIYSNLLLVFTYLYVAGKWEARLHGSSARFAAAIVVVAVIGFNASSTYAGYKLLRIRTDLTREGMRRWERGEQSVTTAPESTGEDPVIKRQRLNGNYEPEDQLLRQSMSLHIYSPPAL